MDHFRITFAKVSSLQELYFRFRRFILLVQTKKVISMSHMAVAPAPESYGDAWNYGDTSIPTWSHSQNSPAVAEALTYRYRPMKHLSNDHKDCPNQQENNHRLCNETGCPAVSLMGIQWKLRQQHDPNFPVERKTL